MKIYFDIKDFCITDHPIPIDVAKKIVKHIEVINPIRNKLGFPIIVSKNSGYRPRWYEVLKGRSGNSEHNFEGKGAVDYTCTNPENTKKLVLELRNSPYKRVCYYPNNNFVHCDFKGDEDLYFEAASPTSPWIKKYNYI